MPTSVKHAERKAKKSYTLSPESVSFLETMRKKRRAASVSSVLEDILQAVRRRQEQVRVEQSVSRYYSSLTSKDAEELAEWAKFAESEFPGER
jgi:hypothetical protein